MHNPDDNDMMTRAVEWWHQQGYSSSGLSCIPTLMNLGTNANKAPSSSTLEKGRLHPKIAIKVLYVPGFFYVMDASISISSACVLVCLCLFLSLCLCAGAREKE